MYKIDDIEFLLEEIATDYKYLHRHPEPGFEEKNTCRFIAGELAKYGIDARRVVPSGIIAEIKGEKPGRTIALRADMDALPVTENSGVDFASETPGFMHACGHDAHTVMLLGAAIFLSKHRDELEGTVRFIFQPAEEGFDMSRMQEYIDAGASPKGGAATMIKHGALEDVDACFALHVQPSYPAGTIAIPVDRFSASSDIFQLKIQGKGGHGSAPEEAIDPTGALAAVIAAYNAFTSREISALDSCSLSIGTISAGEVWNAIPDSASITGGLRAFSNDTRDMVMKRLREIAEGICSAHRCTASFTRLEGYAPAVCDERITSFMADSAKKTLGDENVIRMTKPMMGSEDAGYYFQEVPGAMAWLGAAPKEGDVYPLHHPGFRLNTDALKYGILVHVNTTLDFLSKTGDILG